VTGTVLPSNPRRLRFQCADCFLAAVDDRDPVRDWCGRGRRRRNVRVRLSAGGVLAPHRVDVSFAFQSQRGGDRHGGVGGIGAGEDLYHLDRDALADLDPDVVVTQDLCAVCAVDVSVVDDALAFLGCRAKVVTIDPHTLTEVDESILRLGEVTGRRASSRALVSSIQQRTARVADRVKARPRPRVAVLEWTDPPFAPGHWIPEMVSLAGGDPVIGAAGAASRRISWDDVEAAQPDVVVVAACGYDRQGTTALAHNLASRGVLPPRVRLAAVDANAAWARPGTRLVDGIEELADFLHGRRTGPWPSAKRQARRRTANDDALIQQD
jgi:iron complex transport system substrate-binding protein